MPDKQALLHLVSRAERGALLPGEAQILRDAIEELSMARDTLEYLAVGSTEGVTALVGHFRRPPVIADDDAPGRP